MKLTPRWFLTGLILVVAASPLAFALEGRKSALSVKTDDQSPGATVASAMSTVTGIAISPLLGTGAYGAYQWMTAKDDAAKAALPWYAQRSFWVPALLIVGLCALKDVLGTVVPPGLKKPLDVLETIENKASGFIAAGAVVPATIAAASKLLAGAKAATAAELGGALLAPSGLAMVQVGAVDFPTVINVFTVPIAVAMFAVVWMASHAINVLILLSPWGAIDAALKLARTALLALLALAALANPWVGAALSLVVVVIAWLVAGWAFRLTWFGTVFSWDFFTLRRTRFRPQENDNRLFAGGNFPGVSPRTYGRLVRRTNGGIEFNYRPWLILPERSASVAADKAQLAVGKGLFFSSITAGDGDTLFLLPPRYHGHQEMLARAYGLGGGVRDAGLRRAWSVMKEVFGGSAAQTQVV